MDMSPARRPIRSWARTIFFVGLVSFLTFGAGFSVLRGPTRTPIAGPEFPIIGSDAHTIGSPDAPVQLFVYMDLDCAYCKWFHTITLPRILAAHGADVLVIYREFPLASHPFAYPAAQAAECAYAEGGNAAYFAFVDRLYAAMRPDETYPPSILTDTAQAIGLDNRAFNRCLDTGSEKAAVDRDRLEGSIAGATQAPSILIRHDNRSILVTGNYPAQIEAAIEYFMHSITS